MELENSKQEHALSRYKSLKNSKQPWLDHWQLIGEYIHVRKQNFLEEHEVGEFLNRDIFDSTAPRSAKISASSFVSMLWPQSVKRLRLNPPDSLPKSSAVKKYYEFATQQMMRVFDDPRSGMLTSLNEYMLDQMTFSTSGIEVQKNRDTKLVFKPWGVKHMTIDEGPNGFVDTVYLEQKMPVHKIVKEYGIENVSEKIAAAFNNNKFEERFAVLIAIEPRVIVDTKTKGNQAMPWQSLHIEMESKKLLRQSGFNDIPIKVCRFTKLIGEKYGRGFGTDALPDALEANAIWEAITIAIEKTLDPPLGVLDDGRLGGGEIDTSAGGISTFNSSGRAGDSNPIFPLFVVGEIKQAVNFLEKLDESISNHFSIDRLLDFNNETQMTLGEAQIRNRLRNATLSSIFVRQIAELFNPLIERSFNLLLDDGHLGVIAGSSDQAANPQAEVIPDEVAELMLNGEDVYQIEYFSPAMRVMQAEEAEGIIRTWEMAAQMAALDPSTVDNLDTDESIRKFRAIVGGPSEMERSHQDTEEVRKARAEVAEEQAQQQQALQTSEAMRNVGQSNLLPQLGITGGS